MLPFKLDNPSHRILEYLAVLCNSIHFVIASVLAKQSVIFFERLPRLRQLADGSQWQLRNIGNTLATSRFQCFDIFLDHTLTLLEIY